MKWYVPWQTLLESASCRSVLRFRDIPMSLTKTKKNQRRTEIPTLVFWLVCNYFFECKWRIWTWVENYSHNKHVFFLVATKNRLLRCRFWDDYWLKSLYPGLFPCCQCFNMLTMILPNVIKVRLALLHKLAYIPTLEWLSEFIWLLLKIYCSSGLVAKNIGVNVFPMKRIFSCVFSLLNFLNF
jgi:hypothetical protein